MTGLLSFARLTARREAALAVFRIRGPSASTALARIFVPRGPSPLGPGQVRVGRIVDGAMPVDDAVVRIRVVPDGWEADVATHGGLYVCDWMERILRDLGAAPLPEHDAWAFASRAEPRDLLVADAREALLAAFSEAQTFFLLDAMDGGLSRIIHGLEISLAGGAPGDPLEPLLLRLDALLRRAPVGLALAAPPAVVLTGASNAGKSTLFNALLGESRAIVSPEPGTTRDVVTEPAVLTGYPFLVSDSAGIRPAADRVEAVGVAKAREARAAADIVVLLVDPTGDIREQLAGVEAGHRRARPILAISKGDLPEARRCQASALVSEGAILLSARTGHGVGDLALAIVRASAFGCPAHARRAAPFLARHVKAIERCRRALVGGASRAECAGMLARMRMEGEP